MLKKIYQELVLIRKELQTIRNDLELSEKDVVGAAISDGVQKAVQSAIRGTGVKAEL